MFKKMKKQNKIESKESVNCLEESLIAIVIALLACLRKISLHKNEPFPHVFRADAFSFYSLLTVADLWEFEKNPNFHFVKIIHKGQ